jgi:blue copper oxidase
MFTASSFASCRDPDTVLVWPGEVVRLAIDFGQPCSGTQRYMLHCHNLEHEDMGMMLTFAVTD